MSEFINLYSREKAPKMVVLNDNFVHSSAYDNELINDGDKINIVLFMGGG